MAGILGAFLCHGAYARMSLVNALSARLGLVEKQSATWPAQADAVASQGRTTVPPFEDDESFLKTYKDVAWVYTVVTALAESCAMVPFRLFREVSADEAEDEEVTREDRFRFLRRPNPWMSRFRLWEATFSYLALTGDSHWEVVPDVMNPEQVYPLRPDYMHPVPDPKTLVKEYHYTLPNQEPIVFKPSQIVHFTLFNPLSQFEGLSMMHPVKLAIASDLLAQRYNMAFFENQARPDFVFKHPHRLSDTAFQRLEQRLIAARRGLKRAWSPMILEEGLDVDKLSFAPKDVEYGRGRALNREDISAVSRTPPIMTGLPSVNYASARIQRRMFWEDKIAPWLVRMAEDVEVKLLHHMGPGLSGWFDLSQVPALREDEDARANRLSAQFDRGIITENEYRAAIGLRALVDGDRRFRHKNYEQIGTGELARTARPPRPPRERRGVKPSLVVMGGGEG